MKSKFSSFRLTPNRAKEFQAVNIHPGQRNLNARNVKELANKILDGRFHKGVVAVIHNNDTESLMNGQHQCQAVLTAGKSVPCELHEYWVEKADSKIDIARVFAQYNVDKPRHRGDIAWIYGSQVGMEKWPRRAVQLCNSVLGWLDSGCTNISKVEKDRCAELLATHKADCVFLRDLLFGGTGMARHLLRMPAAAAMVACYRTNRRDATVFWESVRDGANLKKGSAALKLRNYLCSVAVNTGGGAVASQARGKALASGREMYSKCIHAWNAFRAGTNTALKYYPDGPLPTPK